MAFKKRAVAYYRTSSAANIGEGKDTKIRQAEAVKKYALLENMEIVKEFYDENVMGTIPIMDRQEFNKLVKYIVANSIDTILVETANRFSRDLLVQILGFEELKKAGLQLIPVDAPAHFIDDDNPTSEMLRLIIGVISQYEKKSLVKKMGDARRRKRESVGRCEGRIPPLPDAVNMAKELRGTGLSYAAIGKELSKAGFRVIKKNRDTKEHEITDKVYQAQSVKNMIENL